MTSHLSFNAQHQVQLCSLDESVRLPNVTKVALLLTMFHNLGPYHLMICQIRKLSGTTSVATHKYLHQASGHAPTMSSLSYDQFYDHNYTRLGSWFSATSHPPQTNASCASDVALGLCLLNCFYFSVSGTSGG
jgi:hypothetical protein